MTLVQRFTLLFAIFIASAHAIITGFSAPTKTLKAGQHFEVTFTTENHIIQNYQYYVAFGLNPTWVAPGMLGEYLVQGYGYDLVEHNHESSGHGSFNAKVQLPSYLQPNKKTAYSLNAAILQSAGALYGTGVVWFNATVHIKK